MLERFYCPDPLVDNSAILEGDEARHLIRVRRVAIGETVELFDGKGSAYRAEVASLGRDRAVLTVLEMVVQDRAPRLRLTLATAVPKGERFDWLVEKATELGVARLIPLVTERSVVDPRSAKLDRLRRVIVEASKQCRREPPDGPRPADDLGLPGRVGSTSQPADRPSRGLAGSWRPGLATGSSSAILAIGPEGGFTEAEVDARRRGRLADGRAGPDDPEGRDCGAGRLLDDPGAGGTGRRIGRDRGETR